MEKNILNELWQEFQNILKVKTEKDGYFDNYDKELVKIHRIIETESDETKRVLIIKALIRFLNKQIAKDVYSKQIVNSMSTKASDIKRKLNNEDVVFNELTINKIEEFYYGLDCYERKELLELENEYNTKLKEKSVIFGQERARGQIIGELNKGMYESTREDLVKFIRENGEKISNEDRFLDYMSDELLKYRVIGLRMASVYCDKTYDNFLKTAKDSLDRINLDDYDKMREKTNNLGIIIKNLYQTKFDITPREEILANIFGQMMIPEVEELLYPNRDVKKHK